MLAPMFCTKLQENGQKWPERYMRCSRQCVKRKWSEKMRNSPQYFSLVWGISQPHIAKPAFDISKLLADIKYINLKIDTQN